MTKSRNRRKQRLSVSTRSYSLIVLSAVELIIFVLALFLYIKGVGFASKIFSSLGTVSVIAAFAGIVFSVRDMFDAEQSFIGRLFAMLMSMASFIVWAVTYLLGFMSM